MPQIRAATKAYGPYDILNLVELGECQPILTLPFAQVEGSQMIVALTQDNAPAVAPLNDAIFWVNAEIAIFGSFQGYMSCLKRVQLTPYTGPVSYRFDFAETYDQVVVMARNMTGGRRGPGTSGLTTVANGYSMNAHVHIQPRSGFGKV